MKHSLALASLLLLHLQTAAVAQTAAAVTITNGNMVYRQTSLPTTFSNGSPFTDLRAGGASNADHLWTLWWYYRVAGDQQEFTFRADPPPNATTRVANGPVLVTTWPDVANRGLFAATLTETLVSTGADRGYLVSSMAVTNLSSGPLVLDMFSLSDLNAGGSLTNLGWGNLRSQYTERTTAPMHGVEHYCPDADAVQVDDYLTTTPGRLPYLLTNGTVDNLSGWNGTYGPGDHNGAFQWHRTLSPAGSAVFTVHVAVTSRRPLQALYGTNGQGSAGFPTIGTSERAIVDPTASMSRSTDLQLAGARAAAPAVLMTNFASTLQLVQGIHVWVDPGGAPTQFRLTDAAGRASVTLALPPVGALYGLQLYHQFFVLDPGGVGGLAAWTQGLSQTIGSW